MPVHIDEPAPGMAFDPRRFFVRGWLWLEAGHADVVAVEIWSGEQRLGVHETFQVRSDVNARYALPPELRTAFEFFASHPNATAGSQFDLEVRVQLRDGTLTPSIFTSRIGPLPSAEDPRAMLRNVAAVDALGLEIGAHFKPTSGLTPFYTDNVPDFAGTATECVDFFADARALPIADDTLDYLCSSHVLEHLPDPLAALHEWHRVLRPGGWLYLVVPDKRFTFDEPRAVTPPEHILRDFLIGGSDGREHIDDFVDQTHWHQLRPGATSEEKPLQQAAARAEYREKIARGMPVDIHFHTFTPASLDTLLRAAGLVGREGSRFVLAAKAARYPPERTDGIALLLRKSGTVASRPRVETFALPGRGALPSLSLVCPATLQPLHADGDELCVANGGLRYTRREGRPSLLPSTATALRRPWSRRWWRELTTRGGLLRLSLGAGDSP